MVDPEIVRQLRTLHQLRWSTKRIARELGISRNSVRRYLREGAAAETQTRPGAWALDSAQQEALTLLDGPAEGNAVVVKRLLAEQDDVLVPLRTLQRSLAPHRQEKRAAELATVRFETAPGHQMQIDFGERWISISGKRTKVHLFVAVLGYSRRIFVRASLIQRQDDWRDGLASAFRCFAGVTQKILIDRAGTLVVGQDRETGAARVDPVFAGFCKDRGVQIAAAQAPRRWPLRTTRTTAAQARPADGRYEQHEPPLRWRPRRWPLRTTRTTAALAPPQMAVTNNTNHHCAGGPR